MPDKWDDWHVRLPDPKEQLRVIDLYHRSGSGSFVQKYKHRVLIDYSRNKDALPLPLTDALPILPNHRIVSQWQGFYIIGYVCHTGSMADTFDSGSSSETAMFLAMVSENRYPPCITAPHNSVT